MQEVKGQSVLVSYVQRCHPAVLLVVRVFIALFAFLSSQYVVGSVDTLQNTQLLTYLYTVCL